MPILSVTTTLVPLILTIAVSSTIAGPESSNIDGTPLTLDQVVRLVQVESDLENVLSKCEQRGIDFVCSARTLRKLKSVGAPTSLLNAVSQYSMPVREDADLAIKNFTTGDFETAMNFSSDILSKSPRHLDMLWIRAQAQIEIGRLDEAINDLVRLQEFGPLPLPTDATSDRQRINLDRDDEAIATLLLKTRLRAGQFNKVIEESTRLLTEREPELPTLWQIRGLARTFNGNHESAAADFAHALSANPHNSAVCADYAFLLATTTHQRLKNSRAALELAMAAMFLSTNKVHQANAHRAMAATYSCLGDFSAAVREQKKALKLFAPQRSSDYAEELQGYGSKQALSTYNSEISNSRESVVHRLLSQMVRIEPAETSLNTRENISTISDDSFRISSLEVTNADWAHVFERPVNTNPDHPVDRVNWNDCQLFIQKLNTLSPQPVFRLPSESEWALAACGKTSHFSSQSISAADLNEIAWYCANSESRLHPVGQLKANQYGLLDMFGNVAEWCSDTVRTNDGIVYSDFRIHRGGSYASSADFANATQQSYSAKVDRRHGLGLRLAADDRSDFADLVASADPLAVQGFDRVIKSTQARIDYAITRAEKHQLEKKLNALLSIRKSISDNVNGGRSIAK